MTASSLLRSARKLISNPANWISNADTWGRNGVMALDARRNEVRYDDPNACRFSLDGALLRCADLSEPEGQGDYHQAGQYLRGMRKGKALAEINDGSSHAQIVEMLERAALALDVVGRAAA